jgi:hypothetical protein
MRYKILILLILCFVHGIIFAFGQTSINSKSSHVQTISLRQIGKYAESYPRRTLKISNVVLEDVRGFENDWAYLFQLYDSDDNFRRGAKSKNENPCCIQEFSIFADESIGKPLLKRKAEWLNKRANIYVEITDRGLTPFMNVGLVVKVELLNQKGKVEQTLPEN